MSAGETGAREEGWPAGGAAAGRVVAGRSHRAPAFAGPRGDAHWPLPDPAELAAHLAGSPDLEALARRARGVPALGRELVAAGTSGAQVTRTISALADATAARAIELVLAEEDLSEVEHCWLAFGSEGRGEQTLDTDQDNGIVFRAAPGRPVEETRARLVDVARKVNDALVACGYRRCRGGVMAGNPAWCLTEEEWCRRFGSWIDDPTPEALLHATIFFDFRAVQGDPALAEALRDELRRRAPAASRFLALLTGMALCRRPPIGLLHDFAIETGGEHPGTIDLKGAASALFVDAARILALASGEGAPGTVDRLRRAAAVAGMEEREVEAFVEAFDFVQVLRLRHQLEQERHGKEPDNRVDPNALNPLERCVLRESLRQAAALQRRVAHAFGADAAPA